jgi:hypothetical protein
MSTERSGGALVFRVACHREVAEDGWGEPRKSRGLRTVLWAPGGEIPPADPASDDIFRHADLCSNPLILNWAVHRHHFNFRDARSTA